MSDNARARVDAERMSVPRDARRAAADAHARPLAALPCALINSNHPSLSPQPAPLPFVPFLYAIGALRAVCTTPLSTASQKSSSLPPPPAASKSPSSPSNSPRCIERARAR